MSPDQIYDKIEKYKNDCVSIICDLHSACSPRYMCVSAKSTIPVINFDKIKTEADKEFRVESRKSVDGVAVSPTNTYFCFLELKSWDLLLKHNGNEQRIKKQAKKYESDLPQKLTDSIAICHQITNDSAVFDDCKVIYILVTDISVKDDGLSSIASDLMALAGSSSNLKMLCNQLSAGIMNNIPNVETRYWECRNFDENLSTL